MNIQEIRKRAKGYVRFTDHARVGMAEDNISVDNVFQLINNDEII